MKKLVSVAALLITATAGAAFAAANYDLTINKPSAKANERAVARISISPKGSFHVNTEYPVKLTITPPDGVTLEKARLTKDDATRFEKTGLDFDVAFTSAGSGTKTFNGQLKFAVCTDTECKPTVENVSFDVDVK